MIAPNSKVPGKKEREHWHWFAKAVLFPDLTPKDWVIRKKVKSWFWWFARYEQCTDDNVVIRRKTEISQEAVFGNVPAYARITTAWIARQQSDIAQFGWVEARRNICARRRGTRIWANIPFGDCLAEDSVLCRVKCQGEWGTDSLSQCEYSDFIACMDFKAIIRRLTILLLCFAVIAPIVALTVWLIVGSSPTVAKPPEPLRPMQIATITNKSENTTRQNKQSAKKTPARMENGVEVLSSKTSTNSNGVVIEKLVLADGTKMSKIHPPPPIFSNPSDQVIALAISTPPGQAMPPLPDLQGIDRDFMRSLLSPIKINDDDTDEIKDLKKRVMAVKEELVEEIKNGGSVQEVLLAHQKEMNRLSESRLMAIQEMQRIAGEEGVEAAQEFADRVNEHFSEQGIPEIPVIGTHEEKDRRR